MTEVLIFSEHVRLNIEKVPPTVVVYWLRESSLCCLTKSEMKPPGKGSFQIQTV